MAKKKSGRATHQLQKRRARVRRILEKYRGDRYWGDSSTDEFKAMVAELAALNVKYLNVLFEDLDKNRGYGDSNRALRDQVESLILEKTVLK